MIRHFHESSIRVAAIALIALGASAGVVRADEPKTEPKIESNQTPPAPIGIPAPTVTLKPGEVPVATFATPVHDFGRLQADSEVVHEFKFKNTGTGLLEILRVKPGCGCTTAREYTRIVAPGESGVIPIRFKSGSRGGPASKRIEVNTNSPGAGARVDLEIKALVWLPVQITPRSAAFGHLTNEKIESGVTRRLTIVNNTERPMTIGEIAASNPTFKADIKPLEEGKKYELTVSLVPPVSGGNNAGTFRIETGLESPTTITVPAYAFLAPPVDITPTQLVLETPRIAGQKRQFYVRSNTTNPIEVTELKATTDAIQLEIADVRGDRRTYRIGVTIPPAYTPPPQGDEITFKTSDPALPVGRIPVTVIAIHDKDDLPKKPEEDKPVEASE